MTPAFAFELRASLILGAALLLGCRPSDSHPNREGASSDPGITYETFVTGLAVPWSFAFTSNDRILVSERPGRVRVIERGQLRKEFWATVDVINTGEAGLMGLALSPTYEQDHFVYVVGTFHDGRNLVNRVIRLTDENGYGVRPEVLIDSIPAAEFHAGDAIAFGPDGMLYIATGDAGEPPNARDPGSLSGKILRYTPDGAVPQDNPYPASPVYAVGLRNVQGLAWHPESQQLFASDHGPSGFPTEGFRRNNDELNVILRGGNYGWPEVMGVQRDERFLSPIATWTPGIAPSGIAFYDGPVAAWKHNLFVAGLRGQQLRRVIVEPSRQNPVGYRVTLEAALFKEDLGRIRSVVMGPDGYLYFATSNWDGRGKPREGDDRILRLVAK